jgi:HAD superfamily hydrolase (TIGR01509 family)
LRSIQCALLDIGDVLIEVEWPRFYETLGLPAGAGLSRILVHSMHDRYERGQLGSDEFFGFIQGQLELNHSLDEIGRAWNSVLPREVQGVAEVVSELSRTLPLFALSNSNPSHIEVQLKNFRLFDGFREIFTSYKFGSRKPEKEIYLRALKELGLPPDQILFVDDKPENVATARELGLHAEVCMRSPERLRKIFDLA